MFSAGTVFQEQVIYRDKKGFDHAGEVSRLLAQWGLPRRAVSPAEMQAIELTLAGSYYGGYYTENDFTGDIHKFTSGLAAAAERIGVRFLYGQDLAALRSDGRRASVTVRDARSQAAAPSTMKPSW